ncbi:MAG TPA: SMC-Scp complex subunit ScpB [Planctomycetaceae bacterium]|nr:SMC-Scp complex subunit ScpB [Planctomycetaceae bacterium]
MQPDPPTESCTMSAGESSQWWSGQSELEDLEEAYRRALAANEAAESLIGTTAASAESAAGPAPDVPAAGTPELLPPASDPHAAGRSELEDEQTTERLEIARVIEAALFVGAERLTSKRLRRLLGGTVDQDLVTDAIDRLNREYAAENRPYEIRLELGGYRMALRPEFEKVRRRVYGLGPKEVRLSHDALEVLALVAYFQPITRRELEHKGRPNAGGLLRQLLRRELICIQRDPDRPKEVKYCTTDRFLSLFGLGSIEELPQPDDFDFK